MSVHAVPVLETERLVLRGYQIDDLGDSAALWADPVVVRHLGGRALAREEVWSRLLRHAGHWSLLGFGYWAIRDRLSGRFLGEAGFATQHREIRPPLEGAEAGWCLGSWAHGRGLATEAVRAAITWHEQRFGPSRTVCLIDPDNAASIRVAEKCGYRRIARTTYKGEATLVFERT
jgi:RimJ/RimL family protein N-acetyltransferase